MASPARTFGLRNFGFRPSTSPGPGALEGAVGAERFSSLDPGLHPARAKLQAHQFGQRRKIRILAAPQLAFVTGQQPGLEAEEIGGVYEKARRETGHAQG